MTDIVSRHNIDHYSNPMKALREWHRVLKPHGKLGITTPDEGRINAMFLDMTHRHAFSREMMKDMTEATGFKITEMGGTANQWDFYVIAEKNGMPNAHICV